MLHKACHFSMKPLSRADGRSAVAAAAYRAGASFFDERAGLQRSYRSKRDVAKVMMIGWPDDPERMWNMVEAAEARINARVARDWEIALPHELPEAAQERLVLGFGLFLRDRYGLPSMAAIHRPYCDGLDQEITEDLRPQFRRKPKDRGNPKNVHVHILTPDRVWDPVAGAFGEKVRKLSSLKEGPGEIEACRAEWQRRVNRELEKQGVEARVDLRSYARMAAAGDAPEGLVPQPKLGLKNTARSRRMLREDGEDTSSLGQVRAGVQAQNEGILGAWNDWLRLREEGRQALREDGTSEAVAARREAERRGPIEAGRGSPEFEREAFGRAAEEQPETASDGPRVRGESPSGALKARASEENAASIGCHDRPKGLLSDNEALGLGDASQQEPEDHGDDPSRSAPGHFNDASTTAVDPRKGGRRGMSDPAPPALEDAPLADIGPTFGTRRRDPIEDIIDEVRRTGLNSTEEDAEIDLEADPDPDEDPVPTAPLIGPLRVVRSSGQRQRSS